MAVWWFNDKLSHGQPYRWVAVEGSNAAQGRLLQEAETDDVLVCYDSRQQAIVGLARVVSQEEARRPAGYAGATSGPELGVLVHVQSHAFSNPVARSSIALDLLSLRRSTGWPIAKDGTVNRGTVFRFSGEGLAVVRQRSEEAWPEWAEAAIGDGEAAASPNMRSSATAARQIVERLLPDADARRVVLSALVDAIGEAHGVGPNRWGLTLHTQPDGVRLNAGRLEAFCIRPSFVRAEVHRQTLEAAALALPAGARLADLFKNRPQWPAITMDIETAAEMLPQLREANLVYVREASQESKRTPFGRSHSPGLLAYLREEFPAREVPDPAYGTEGSDGNTEGGGGRTPICQASLTAAFASAGLHYTPAQLATFLTALQTKGFVILSGISGTGKSKIAQRLADLLPKAPAGAMDVVGAEEVVRVQKYMANHRRIAVPARLRNRYERPASDKRVEIPIHYDGQTQDCRYWVRDGYADIITFRGTLPAWFETTFQVGDQLVIRPEVDDDGRLTAIHLGRPAEFAPATQAADSLDHITHLFLPVRPDWRDSKPLLGYYNPLTREYQSTEFLRFLQRAKANWDGPADQRVAFVVILDEMNLARVEYYFADLLSILESGRDADGLTKEAIRFEAASDEYGEADLPPDLKLPPNLYIVGTVNVDETTHGFSPKVLDRAFTIELNEVDFTHYPPTAAIEEEVDDATQRQVLDLLSGHGQWAQVRKERVADVVVRHGDLRSTLIELNEHLRKYHLHIGYRVFDEICAYVDAAEQNGLWTTIGGWEAAFDAAVLMKVLPKFHGSLAKLQEPLETIRDWCGDALPRTRERVVRMLSELDQVGFTAFS